MTERRKGERREGDLGISARSSNFQLGEGRYRYDESDRRKSNSPPQVPGSSASTGCGLVTATQPAVGDLTRDTVETIRQLCHTYLGGLLVNGQPVIDKLCDGYLRSLDQQAEIDALRKLEQEQHEIATEAQQEIERLRVQLAGCGVEGEAMTDRRTGVAERRSIFSLIRDYVGKRTGPLDRRKNSPPQVPDTGQQAVKVGPDTIDTDVHTIPASVDLTRPANISDEDWKLFNRLCGCITGPVPLDQAQEIERLKRDVLQWRARAGAIGEGREHFKKRAEAAERALEEFRAHMEAEKRCDFAEHAELKRERDALRQKLDKMTPLITLAMEELWPCDAKEALRRATCILTDEPLQTGSLPPASPLEHLFQPRTK